MRLHGGRLLAVTRRLLGNEEDARDAVQEAFLNAYRAIQKFQGDSLLSTWLHRIAVNVSLMKLRTRRRRPEESLDHLLPAFKENGHFAERFDTGDESAEQRLARLEEQAAVRAAIDELPDHHRTILLLRDIEGIGTNDVAEQLGITPTPSSCGCTAPGRRCAPWWRRASGDADPWTSSPAVPARTSADYLAGELATDVRETFETHLEVPELPRLPRPMHGRDPCRPARLRAREQLAAQAMPEELVRAILDAQKG